MDGRQQGTTLLEVLLAMTVLTFGLFSIAAVQVRALQVVEEGRRDTQALYLAHAMIERTRSGSAERELASWQAAVRELMGTSVQAAARRSGDSIEVEVRWRDRQDADGMRSVLLQGRASP